MEKRSRPIWPGPSLTPRKRSGVANRDTWFQLRVASGNSGSRNSQRRSQTTRAVARLPRLRFGAGPMS